VNAWGCNEDDDDNDEKANMEEEKLQTIADPRTRKDLEVALQDCEASREITRWLVATEKTPKVRPGIAPQRWRLQSIKSLIMVLLLYIRFSVILLLHRDPWVPYIAGILIKWILRAEVHGQLASRLVETADGVASRQEMTAARAGQQGLI